MTITVLLGDTEISQELCDRVLEEADRLAEAAVEFGVTGPWVPFSPSECKVIAAALALLPTVRTVVGMVVPLADAEVEEALRVKAVAGTR